MAEDSELWYVICDGPFIPMKTIGKPAMTVPKIRKEYNDADCKAIEKNFRAKEILVYGIGPNEYNRISACQSAKEIWEALQIAHEGKNQVKQSKIDMLTTEYELFRMYDDESIQDMHSLFTSIINELHSLEEIIPRNKLVRKILSVLPGSWESKVNVITKLLLHGEIPPVNLKEMMNMMAVESEVAKYDSIFALMAKFDDDKDDDDDEVNFLDVQRNLKPYS
uniref:Uncharacterized protein LOC104211543 n=1 Tax=Nicotiana sylvestris TaxID=4096 RepID=A0A1U7V1S6_NICSY|nr:PREDICTED: uncharacterized protein LOC104211543 [Nicotiana sylvestris]